MVATPAHLLDTTVTIQRATMTAGTAGGPTKTWATLASGVPARVQPQGGTDNAIYGAERANEQYTVFIPGDQAVSAEHRLVWSGLYLKIKSPPKNLQAAGVLKRLDCEEMTP